MTFGMLSWQTAAILAVLAWALCVCAFTAYTRQAEPLDSAFLILSISSLIFGVHADWLVALSVFGVFIFATAFIIYAMLSAAKTWSDAKNWLADARKNRQLQRQ